MDSAAVGYNRRSAHTAQDLLKLNDKLARITQDLVDSTRAAALLGVSVYTLKDWRLRGYGPSFVRPAYNVVRYRYQDLVRWRQLDLARWSKQNTVTSRARRTTPLAKPTTALDGNKKT
jgi:hypothetical protein